MAKKEFENKAMSGAPASKAGRPNPDTLIEGRDAGPGEAEYNYPHQNITVVASSQEEADRKMNEVLKGRKTSNAHEAENN